MTTAEERMKILDMIREGKISPEEGARLLQALHTGAKRAEERDKGRAAEGRWLRVRVTKTGSTKPKVNVTVPMSLVNVGIKLGARFIPTEKESDFNRVLEAIRSGQIGKVFDYENEDEGERVEVWVE